MGAVEILMEIAPDAKVNKSRLFSNEKCEFMSTRFFICPGALWRLLFENVSMKLYKCMGQCPALPPVILMQGKGGSKVGTWTQKGLWEMQRLGEARIVDPLGSKWTVITLC